MPYAVRRHGPEHDGMLVAMSTKALAKIRARQDKEDALRDAYWEAEEEEEEETRGEEPPVTYPYYEPVAAYNAHKWVLSGRIHETLLFVEDGKIRKAR